MGNIDPLVLEIFALAANLATVFGVCVATAGVIVAIVGGGFAYNSWKREIRGSAKFDLAQEILMSVYILRKAVKRYRMPMKPTPDTIEVLKEQYPIFEEYSKNPWLYPVPQPEDELEDLAEKWPLVAEAEAQVETLKIRSEILLHPEVANILENISKYIGLLYVKSRDYEHILDRVVGVPFERLPREDAQDMWDAYIQLFYQPDYQGYDFFSLIEQLEDKLKRYLQ
jgi:hypothetical protein